MSVCGLRHERPLGDEQLKQKETVERLSLDRHSNTKGKA